MRKISFLVLLFCVLCPLLHAQVSIKPLLKDSVFRSITMQNQSFSEIESAIISPKLQYSFGPEWNINPAEFSVYLMYSFQENDFIHQEIAVSPADTLTYTIEPVEKLNSDIQKRYVMKFYGKNASHYNYNWEKEIALPSDTNIYYKKGMNVLSLKKHCQNVRDRELSFLEKYRKEHAVSTEFYNYAYADILNTYAGRLYDVPRHIALSSLPQDYFDDAILIENKHTNYNFVLKNKFLFAVKDSSLNYPQEIYLNIEKNTPPNRKEFLLTNFITRPLRKITVRIASLRSMTYKRASFLAEPSGEERSNLLSFHFPFSHSPFSIQ